MRGDRELEKRNSVEDREEETKNISSARDTRRKRLPAGTSPGKFLVTNNERKWRRAGNLNFVRECTSCHETFNFARKSGRIDDAHSAKCQDPLLGMTRDHTTLRARARAPAIRIYCWAEEIEGCGSSAQRFTTPANLRPRGVGMSNAFSEKESMAIPLSGKTLLNRERHLYKQSRATNNVTFTRERERENSAKCKNKHTHTKRNVFEAANCRNEISFTL